MNSSFEKITALQYSLKAAERQIQAFQSGEKYVQLEKKHRKLVRSLEETVKKLKRELEAALEEERGKNQKLTAQLNRDYENSSLPSSAAAGRSRGRY